MSENLIEPKAEVYAGSLLHGLLTSHKIKCEDEQSEEGIGKESEAHNTAIEEIKTLHANKNCEMVVEIQNASDPVTFKVDRRQVAEVQLADNVSELNSLGLAVYDQDVLEEGILRQVDEALEELDRRKLEQQMAAVSEDIVKCKQDLKKSETFLKALELTGATGQKRAIVVRKAIENKCQQLKHLQTRADSLKNQYNKTHINNQTNITQHVLEKARPQESEEDRKIRLGEMTPFGNVLSSQVSTLSSGNDFTQFEKYLQKQTELQEKRDHIKVKNKKKTSSDGSDAQELDSVVKTNKKSPLKKSILVPKKRRKKEKLGTRSSENWWDMKKRPGKLLSEKTELEDSEDSEYLPSESEEEEKETRKYVKVTPKKEPAVGKRRRKQYVDSDWATDDSDWEYSDEDTRAKRRKSRKKEIDDGNIEDYHERLKLWEEEEMKREASKETGSHELGGGYKIPKELWTKLYNYQKVGVQWLWELNQQRCGGILGDEMGLGKTVQMIAFLAGLNHSKLLSRHSKFRGMGPTLIVCPTTVMHQWVREFHVWWPQFRVAVLHESGSFHGKRQALISQMNQVGCVLVTSYVGVVQHQDALIAKDWHYVILDEGHKIRNPDAQVTLAVKQFRTPHRVILSGSPMQNNLKELWSLFDFVFPGKLGTLPVFLAQMAVPITQGGYANASEVQVATAYRCATVLRDTIAPYLLRRMKADVSSHIQLPQKNEQVLFCKLTEEQRSLYKSYLDSGEVERILQGRFQVFVGLIALRKICNHPDLYSGGPKLFRGDNEEDLPEESRYGFWKRAGKMLVVESLLNIWHKQKHRVLLFSQTRQMLCILELFIQKKGYKYLKLDGGTSIASRQPLINKFNEDTSYFIFLLTTRVGGLGINLTGADRVVIYDPDWNPATDTQARERAWRIGQQNSVTVYRLVTAGTIEEKMYHRQIFKQFLCNKVLRDPRQRRFFKSNDLLELFTLAESEGTTETAAIFAGTGSEVKMSAKKPKSVKEKKVMPGNTETTRHKNGESESVRFSHSKLERMKRLAKLLSNQIVAANKSACEIKEFKAEQVEASSSEPSASSVQIPVEITISSESKETHRNDVKCNNNKDCAEITVKLEEKSVHGIDSETSHRHGKKHRHHSKKHSRRKKKGAVFEGERVPYLVGQSESKGPEPEEIAEEDDYVLRKLFKKSGIQTAMKHDAIMGDGDADYALVEGEAKRVAKEAIKALRESRSHCFQADRGVPTWTGQSGALRRPSASSSQPKLKFGKKKPASASLVSSATTKEETKEDNKDQPMSSSELLTRMRARNRLLEPLAQQEPQEEQAEEQEGVASSSRSTLPISSVESDQIELLSDIRNFVAFGASVDGRASTQEILAEFSSRLPPGSSPLFKFMLSDICEFYRLPSGEGMWKLRSEFR